jgi:hypothetical protein
MMATGSGVTLQVNYGDEVLEPYTPEQTAGTPVIGNRRRGRR